MKTEKRIYSNRESRKKLIRFTFMICVCEDRFTNPEKPMTFIVWESEYKPGYFESGSATVYGTDQDVDSQIQIIMRYMIEETFHSADGVDYAKVSKEMKKMKLDSVNEKYDFDWLDEKAA